MTTPSVASVGTYDTAASGTTLAPGVPTGVVAGTFVMLFVGGNGGTGATPTPIGFTSKGGAFNFDLLYAFYKTASGTDSGTYPVTIANPPRSAVAVRIQDFDTTTPLGSISVSADQGAGATTTAPVSLTGVPAGAMLIWASERSVGSSTMTVPTGFTRVTASASQQLHVATMALPAGGSTGTITGTMPTAEFTRSVLIAVLPSAGGVTNFNGTASRTETVATSGAGLRGVLSSATTVAATTAIVATGVVAGIGVSTGSSLSTNTTTSASGQVGGSGAANRPESVATSSTGAVGRSSASALTALATTIAAGSVDKSSATAATFAVGTAASGSLTISGSTSQPVTVTLAASGSISAAGVGGASSLGVGANTTSTGSVSKTATASRTVTAGTSSTGSVSATASGLLATAVATGGNGTVSASNGAARATVFETVTTGAVQASIGATLQTSVATDATGGITANQYAAANTPVAVSIVASGVAAADVDYPAPRHVVATIVGSSNASISSHDSAATVNAPTSQATLASDTTAAVTTPNPAKAELT